MPAHNIIDNRREKLVDHINRIPETGHAGGVERGSDQLLNDFFIAVRTQNGYNRT